METRRLFLFVALSVTILFGWNTFVLPLLIPQRPVQKPQAAGQQDPAPGVQAEKQNDAPQADEGAQADHGAKTGNETGAAPDDKTADDGADAAAQVQHGQDVAAKLPDHRHRTVTLGTPRVNSESGYFMAVKLDSLGAAITEIALNDSRYRVLKNPNPQLPHPQLSVVGNNLTESPKALARTVPEITLQTSVPQIDDQLKRLNPRASLKSLNWEVLETVRDPQNDKIVAAATFRLVSPDGRWEIRKQYGLHKVKFEGGNPKDFRDTSPDGYQIAFRQTLINRGEQAQSVQYTLQGPTGLPLENAEHTRKLRDLKWGYLEDDGQLTAETYTAKEVVDMVDEKVVEEWKKPLRYIGVDVQYFAALVSPVQTQEKLLKSPLIDSGKPVLVDRNEGEPSHSDISVLLTSKEFDVPADDKGVTHEFTLFAGPKREALLAPLQAEEVLEFGFFSPIARAMLWMLQFFHNWGIPYGAAIICLTIVVRGCMFPISRKQAAGAKKMKELQPKIAELKEKHGSDKEKLARAQMELFRKHGYNPLAGCLPLFLQLPIFIGLYNSLNTAVDLRMAPFLWFDNLAAPDALFRLPIELPFLGQDFNLLPLLTVVLFIVQQKMFMPPPDPNDQNQVLQHKMMNYMMIFMGFLFYHVPAGLCVYFIASSLWGMGERKLLDLGKKNADGTALTPAAGGAAASGRQNTGNNWSTKGDQEGRRRRRRSRSRR